MTQTLESQLHTLLEPSLTSMGYELVQLKLGEIAKRRTLSLLVERLDGKRIAVLDCEAVSRRASALLDVENLMESAFDLEVSSAGIDRPLVKPKDYAAYVGFEAKIELHISQNERKRFRGLIKAADEAAVTLECDGEAYTLSYAQIRTAKLVLTDALIKETQKRVDGK